MEACKGSLQERLLCRGTPHSHTQFLWLPQVHSATQGDYLVKGELVCLAEDPAIMVE